MRASRWPVFLVGLCLAAAALDCAAQASRIVFTRSGTNSSTLYRINADGSGLRQLLPFTSGVLRSDAAWSPSGASIAYVRTAVSTSHGDIWLMSSTGGSPRRLTLGSADHYGPAWRPDGGMIAYIAKSSTGACVGIVRPDGTGQHNVFCPPGPAFVDYKPQWSRDGTRLFVSASRLGSGLEPPLFVNAYRVNPSTGGSTLLTAQSVDSGHPRQIFFAPDGTHGLLASGYSDTQIENVDFATDIVTPLTQGYAPVFSHDGSRFAYSKFGFTGSPTFYSFYHAWVMEADGSSEHEVTPALVDNLEYVSRAWSRDDRRLLLNRTVYMPESPGSGTYVGTPAMRIFNVTTSAFVSLPTGSADSWYQSP